MKKHISIITAAVLLGSLLLLSGCNKTGIFGEGRLVKFGTVSGGAQTRAAYGINNEANTQQAIDWTVGDLINVASAETAVNNAPNEHVAGYRIAEIQTPSTAADVKSVGKLELAGSNGLAWPDEDPDGGYDFYAVYPNLTITEAGLVTASVVNPTSLSGSTSTKYIKADGTPAESATDAAYTYKVYEPSLAAMPMTAAVHVGKSGTSVNLPFGPAFTALEFNITSADEDFTVTKVELVGAEADKIAGGFTMTAGNLATVTPTDATNSIAVTMNEALTSGTGVTFTLFMLPKENTGVVNLKVTTSSGTATLPMTKKNGETTEAFKFAAGKKYRINMLKLGGKFSYAIALAGKALPWTYNEEKTTFSENVQAKAIYIDGSLETLESYTNAQTTIDLYGKATSNHYEAYDTATNDNFKSYAEWVALGSEQAAYNEEHKTYYQLYYQLRNMDMSVSNPHFVVTFTPIAPLGGYWNLSAETAPSYGNTAQGGPEGFDIYLWDGESNLSSWSSGQIMNQEVTLNIYPSAQRDPSKEYCMLIKAYFSPNKNGEPTYSADSEMQDVHGDGRYSYWKLVIPATE